MSDAPDTTVTDPVTELERCYPDWLVWQSDTGRWWASRRRRLTTRQQQRGFEPHVSGASSDELAERLAEQDGQVHPR